MIGTGRLEIAIAKAFIQPDVTLLAHEVNGFLAHLRHLRDEGPHQQRRVAVTLVRRVDHHRHDYDVRRGRVVPDKFLKRLVGHDHFERTPAVDKADHFPVEFHHKEPLRVLGDASGNLISRGSFVALIGRSLDFKAAVSI